jgi:sporulation protein YlmC with PRC-barrel domain
MSTIALMAAPMALAQDQAPADGDKEMPAVETPAGTEGAGEVMKEPMEPAAEMESAEEVEPAESMEPAANYGSFNKNQDFQGSITGGYTAEDLIGRDVIDANGDDVATVSDLAIGSDDSVQQVIMDVGGFLGLGAKTVAIDIESLEIGADDEIRLTMTKEELEALPSYEEGDDGWNIAG